MPGLAFLLRTAEPDRRPCPPPAPWRGESGVSEALALLLEQQRMRPPGAGQDF